MAEREFSVKATYQGRVVLLGLFHAESPIEAIVKARTPDRMKEMARRFDCDEGEISFEAEEDFL